MFYFSKNLDSYVQKFKCVPVLKPRRKQYVVDHWYWDREQDVIFRVIEISELLEIELWQPDERLIVKAVKHDSMGLIYELIELRKVSDKIVNTHIAFSGAEIRTYCLLNKITGFVREKIKSDYLGDIALGFGTKYYVWLRRNCNMEKELYITRETYLDSRTQGGYYAKA